MKKLTVTVIAIFIFLTLEQSFAGINCLNSSYHPQVVVISSCEQRVCFATVTCGEGKDDNKPGPWGVSDLKPETVVYSTAACPAASDGTCPSDLGACQNLAKKSNYVIGEMGVPSGLPNNPTSDGKSALQYQSLSVVKFSSAGACSTPICVGNVKQYDYNEILDAAMTSDKDVKKRLLAGIEPVAVIPITCPGNDSSDPKQMSCPGVNKCAADQLTSAVAPGSAESKAPAHDDGQGNSQKAQVGK